ncbi:MAG: ATP-binding protein [Magnetococcus sp. YQC-3]
MGTDKKNKRTAPLLEKAPRRLFGYLPDIILMVDRRRRVLFMNRAMEGRFPKRMVGRDSALLFPRGFRAWYRRSLGRLFQEAVVDRFQYSTEESVWWEVHLVPIHRGRQVVEAMVLCSDVTEKRILQAQSIRHSRLATIGVLAAGIAHEVNNPNSAILFNASTAARVWEGCLPVLEDYFRENGDFLLGGISFTEARQTMPTLFAEMLHNSRRVEQIVENLKSLARHNEESPNTAEPALPDMPVAGSADLHAVLRAAIMILNHKIHHHTDFFSCTLEEESLPVPGNASQLEQVFINVILNALQSLPSREKGVRVWTTRGEATVQVIVEDEGVGISAENIAHLTEPFFTTRLSVGGTGLGLSISNLILRRHRASIQFQSVVGQGTRVTIHLPLHMSGELLARSDTLGEGIDSGKIVE